MFMFIRYIVLILCIITTYNQEVKHYDYLLIMSLPFLARNKVAACLDMDDTSHLDCQRQIVSNV